MKNPRWTRIFLLMVAFVMQPLSPGFCLRPTGLEENPEERGRLAGALSGLEEPSAVLGPLVAEELRILLIGQLLEESRNYAVLHLSIEVLGEGKSAEITCVRTETIFGEVTFRVGRVFDEIGFDPVGEWFMDLRTRVHTSPEYPSPELRKTVRLIPTASARRREPAVRLVYRQGHSDLGKHEVSLTDFGPEIKRHLPGVTQLQAAVLKSFVHRSGRILRRWDRDPARFMFTLNRMEAVRFLNDLRELRKRLGGPLDPQRLEAAAASAFRSIAQRVQQIGPEGVSWEGEFRGLVQKVLAHWYGETALIGLIPGSDGRLYEQVLPPDTGTRPDDYFRDPMGGELEIPLETVPEEGLHFRVEAASYRFEWVPQEGGLFPWLRSWVVRPPPPRRWRVVDSRNQIVRDSRVIQNESKLLPGTGPVLVFRNWHGEEMLVERPGAGLEETPVGGIPTIRDMRMDPHQRQIDLSV